MGSFGYIETGTAPSIQAMVSEETLAPVNVPKATAAQDFVAPYRPIVARV